MNFSFRKLLTLAAVAVTLGVLAVEADARVGGGSSSGSRGSRTFSAPAATKTAPSAAPIQRTITQPGSTVARPGQPATQPGGFFNRPGLLGGLAAGFLGAGLLGLLFGGGLSGGLGGIASFFGLVLQLGLIALVAMLAWRWFQNRNQPAVAGGPNLREVSGQGPAGGFGGMGFGSGSGSGSAPQSAPLEIVAADYDAFERLLGETQAAFSAEDLNRLRSLATPEMVSFFAEQLTDNASHGVVNQISEVKLLQGDLSEAWREDGVDYATVAMRFSLVDKTMDRASGRMVDGSDAPQEVTEFWTFTRSQGGSWLVSAIQQS